MEVRSRGRPMRRSLPPFVDHEYVDCLGDAKSKRLDARLIHSLANSGQKMGCRRLPVQARLLLDFDR